MSSSSASMVSGRARSCTGCRQVKLACDARRAAPQPCSRCRNKGLQCKFDSNFKRIPMRRVAQEITNGIHRLIPTAAAAAAPAPSAASPARSSVTTDSHASPSKTLPSIGEGLHTSIAGVQATFDGYAIPRHWLQVTPDDHRITYSLGNVELDIETAASLFKHFEQHHLRHAPFLESVDSLFGLARKSPLLFWTIILVTTREHENHDGLYEQICIAHGVLLSQLTQIAINTIEAIHALLLLCLWPVPKVRENDDPAWNYIGLAIHAAMQLNCHRPLPAGSTAAAWRGMMSQTGAQIGTAKSALTWIYCFEMGVRLAAAQGLPSPLATTSQLQSVASAVASATSVLTEEQKAVCEILRLSALSTSEVDATEDPQTRYSLIQMFDKQFASLFQAYQAHWTTELDIELQASKLSLHALMLTLPDGVSNDSYQHQSNKQLILLRMHDAASRLISKMTQLSNSPVEEGSYPAGLLSFHPKHYFTTLFMAAISMFRFLASFQNASQQDTVIVVNGLTATHRIFQSFPEHRDAVKAAITIQYIVDIIRNPEGTHPYPLAELVLKNRLGASLVYDGVFRAAHHRNRDSVTGASPPVSNWLGLDTDPRQRLPLTPEQRIITSTASSSNRGAEDVAPLVPLPGTGPWSDWDTYIDDFEIGLEQWNDNVLAQMDSATQAQMYEAAAMSTMPVLGQHTYMYPGM